MQCGLTQVQWMIWGGIGDLKVTLKSIPTLQTTGILRFGAASAHVASRWTMKLPSHRPSFAANVMEFQAGTCFPLLCEGPEITARFSSSLHELPIILNSWSFLHLRFCLQRFAPRRDILDAFGALSMLSSLSQTYCSDAQYQQDMSECTHCLQLVCLFACGCKGA